MPLKTAFTPEKAYPVWNVCWMIAGAALLWRQRAALRRKPDGRAAWSGEPSRIAIFFGLYVGLMLAISGLGAGIAQELVRALPAAPGRDLALSTTIQTGLMAGALLFLRRHVPELAPPRPHRVAPAGAFGFTPAGVLHGFAGAILAVGVTAVVWTLLLQKTGYANRTGLQDQVRLLAQSGDALVFGAITLGAVIFAPVHEELAYRCGLFAALRARMPRLAAYAVTGLVFGLMHQNLNGFLPLAALGAWLAWLYDTTADLRVPIVVHALFNANTVLWTFLAPGAVA